MCFSVRVSHVHAKKVYGVNSLNSVIRTPQLLVWKDDYGCIDEISEDTATRIKKYTQ